ncbi:MAG: aldo/keto reductase [Planctomycetota bacterium]|jgi:aryl-alcohol dehydrogenase-like predicted oxidoreductase
MDKQLNNNYSRRQFIGTVLAGTGALVAGPQWSTVQAARKSRRGRKITDVVELGKSGIKTTMLAQGTGWNGGARSSAHTRLGEKEFTRLIRHSIDQGVRFMDMADLYGSHPYVRNALKEVSRDDYEILTKIWPREQFWNMPSGGAKEEVNRYRKELNSEVLEVCLIHCMTDTQWPETFKRIRDELSEMKDKGAVKAIGVSCHDLGALKVAATHPWTDVVFARINNAGSSMDGSPEEVAPVLKQARANGKMVIGMKIFGAGKLTNPEQKDASLKFVFENELVDAITIGMMKPEEVGDTIRRANKALRA